MFMAGMELILFVTTILPCLCLGAGVELTVSTSPGTERGSLTMTCSVTANSSALAIFYKDDNIQIGFVQSAGGKCKNDKEQVCKQQCSCAPDGTSFSWTISSVTGSLDITRVRCEVYNPKSTYSEFVDIGLKSAGVELTASSSPVTEGGSLNLTCSWAKMSFPNATFFYENGTYFGYVRLVGGECKDRKNQSCGQQCSCTPDGKSFSMTISNVTRSWDKARVKCRVYDKNPTARYSHILGISVLYAPKNKTLYIAYPSVVYEGDDVNLDCGIERGNPLATLSWTCVDQSKETSSDVDNGGTNRHYRRLRISSITRDYNGRQCVCTATHPRLAQNLTRSAVITVYFPPSVPVLTVDTVNGMALPWLDRPGFTGILLCKITGGNPPTFSIFWNHNGVFERNQATRTRRFNPPNKYYNGRNFTCRAHNNFTITKSIIRRSNGILLNVEYDPVITLNTSTAYISEDMSFNRTCSAEGNPSPSVRWYHNSNRLTTQQQTLKFNRTDRENAGNYTCIATARYTGYNTILQSSQSFSIVVQYDPVITLNTSTAYISEDMSFNRTCSAEGNPSPSVRWYHNSNRLTTQQQTLKFNRTDRENAGNYTCIATARYTGYNTILQSSQSFSIVVQYGPDVELAITNTTENETNVRLKCTANGVPNRYTYKWKHMFGSTVIRDTFDHDTNVGLISTLTIPRVTYQDMGTYICEVGNGYKGRDGQIAQTRQGVLSVKGSPRAIGAQDRYVTEKGISLDINITYISFPEPVNTSILRVDSALPPQSELSINVTSVPVTVPFYNIDVSVDGYMVHLHFSKFETKHRGHYQLHVRNGFDYNYKFEIVISDKPDTPTDLMIGQITESSAVVSWIPGEDNGNFQTFTMTYQRYSGGIQTDITLNHTISSYTVENLDISTTYDVMVIASNTKGTSEIITSTFKTKSAKPSDGNVAIIGVAAGSAAAGILLVICVVVVIMRRRRRQYAPKPAEDEPGEDNDGLKVNVLYESAGPNYPQQPGPSNSNPSGRDVYAAVDKSKSNVTKDGLKVNVLYESAGPNYPQQPGPSNWNPSGKDVYAVVDKSKSNVAETQFYAEVNKQQKAASDSAEYAEIQKTEKGKAKKDAEVVKNQTKEVTDAEYAEVKKTKKGKSTKKGMVNEDIGDVDGTGAQSDQQQGDI